ncbi:PBECR2 nuclease fold domain-containing protein [Campylobacter cuniculorum]|nr:PBECR2 nuclease fold domain-containing protein [Campylobacter cuniculorum]
MATSIQGSAQVKITNFLMDSILRNLSLPFFLRGGTMDQSISKRALKFQIERALNHADGLSDFKKILQSKTKTGDFSNGTRKALEQFTQALEKSEDEFYEQLKRIESKDLNASLQEEKNADIIGGLRQQAGEPKGLKPPTSKDDYNTNAKFSQEHIKQVLEHLQAQDITRKHLSDEEINALLKRFDNIDNLKEHLYTRADAQTRKALFDLIDETLYNPHFKYIKDGKTKYLKKFKDTDKDKDAYFYLLITKDQDKTFITHLKSRDYNYFAKELSTAEQLLQGENLIKIKPKDEALNAKTQEGLKQDVQSQDLEKAWLNTFNLKSLDEDFIPNLNAQAREALKDVLKGEQIHLKSGSLVKLIKQHRLKYLDRIRPTLEHPERIIMQNDGALIFAKNFNEKKHFTSIAKNEVGEWIITSNAPKSERGLNNKIKQGGKELYHQAASQINANRPYVDKANSNIKLDNADYTTKTQEKQEQVLNPLKHNETLENAGVKDLKNAKNTSEESLNAKTQEGLKQDVQSQDLEKAWLNTFNLKSLDEDFIPNLNAQAREALKDVLKDKPLKINRADFEKLRAKDRLKYINEIKDTLENPQLIFKDAKGDLIFAKEIKEKLFLTNISREYEKGFLSVSISPKKVNTIKNKLEKAQNIYLNKLDFKLRESSAQKAFTGVLSLANKPNSKQSLTNQSLKHNETLENAGVKDLKNAKEKTIKAIDNYAQSADFKALSKDKQEAILTQSKTKHKGNFMRNYLKIRKKIRI